VLQWLVSPQVCVAQPRPLIHPHQCPVWPQRHPVWPFPWWLWPGRCLAYVCEVSVHLLAHSQNNFQRGVLTANLCCFTLYVHLSTYVSSKSSCVFCCCFLWWLDDWSGGEWGIHVVMWHFHSNTCECWQTFCHTCFCRLFFCFQFSWIVSSRIIRRNSYFIIVSVVNNNRLLIIVIFTNKLVSFSNITILFYQQSILLAFKYILALLYV